MGQQALIGFHAAYKITQDGRSTETGAGNACLGAYLNKLGLPDRAVLFITQSSPESMTWLTPDAEASEGINVSLFASPEKPATATNPPPTTYPSLAAPQPPNRKVTKWLHNVSIVSLSEAGESVEINYESPRPGMIAVGVRPGTMLFHGTRTGAQIEGKAYIFHA
jgi:hypothetical protein